METESDGGGVARCVRHPWQILSGICSFCLAERLCGVVTAGESETVENESDSRDVRARRSSLLSLFELDDQNTVEKSEGCVSNSTKDAKLREDEKLKGKGGSFWGFAKRAWRLTSSKKKSRMPEQNSAVGFEDRGADGKQSNRHSCDWTSLCSDSARPSLDVSRYSCDGRSTLTRAFNCSCLEEPQGDDSCRMGRNIPEEAEVRTPFPASSSSSSSLSNARTNINDGAAACEKRLSLDGNFTLNERIHEETHQQVPYVLGISRKKSNRWSKVRDWSITSPLRDLSKKREHVLERSLSEAQREGNKDKNMEGVESNVRIRFNGNGHISVRTNQSSNRSTGNANGDHHNPRMDWQKKKEYKFGRSRSAHYSYTENLGSGLLRFYLTPLRSSRGSRNRGPLKKPPSFQRGISGLQ